MIMLLAEVRAQWAELDRRIAAFDAEFIGWTKDNEAGRRLATIPGVGARIASALIAAIGNAETFERGRDLAAWLGLVPRQFTAGGQAEASGHQQARQQISAQVVARACASLGSDDPALQQASIRQCKAISFAANVVTAAFKGKSKGQQHQMVYAALKGKMGGDLHALALTTSES